MSTQLKEQHSFRRSVTDWVSIRGDNEKSIPVFIKDPTFAWLPAKLLTLKNDTATVMISLPEDWHETTTHDSSKRIDFQNDEIRNVNLNEYVGKELPFQNVDEEYRLVGKSDMAGLSFLHEAAILYNLKERHARGVPYTRVGDILVATNPFQWIDGLYSEEKQNLFANRIIWKATTTQNDNNNQNEQQKLLFEYEKLGGEPHVYETSSLAYKGLASDHQNQAILVTGESGAGKTETIKIVMTHLARIQSTRDQNNDDDDSSSTTTPLKKETNVIVEKVLQSNPLFEAFGNAKTLKNDNSSRFGKFTQLRFAVEERHSAERAGRVVPLCLMAGSTSETYLLEKSRVVGHDVGERSYHIFYQLLVAPKDFKARVWEGLVVDDTISSSSFCYLGSNHTDGVDGLSELDEENWQITLRLLALFGITEDKLTSLFRAICTVLQLGNLTFGPDPSGDGATITSIDELEKTSQVIGVPIERLTMALTKRKIQTKNEEIHFALNPTDAKDTCDALAKELYARIFDYLVRTINSATTEVSSHSTSDKTTNEMKNDCFGVIGLLDIFGFELFDVNRFEQLCINYANERLQSKYVMDIFHSIQAEYEEEGIEVFDFSKVDNSGVLDLIEGRTGLIAILNDECIRPKGNASSFVYKIKAVHMSSKYLVREKLHSPYEFGVVHFASPVKYNTQKFIERNTDVLPQDLVDCAKQSTNQLIANEFNILSTALHKQSNVSGMSRTRGSSSTVISKFKRQLNTLLKNIQHSKTRYIRCIKPNAQGIPKLLDHKMAMSQLESAGLVTAIAISRESFPNHLPYEVFLERFRCLLSSADRQSNDSEQDDTKRILSRLLKKREKVVGGSIVKPFACGKTKVFFRTGELEFLETERMRVYEEAAIKIQTWARFVIQKQTYRTMKNAIVVLQARWRGKVQRVLYGRRMEAVVRIQCCIRCVMAIVQFKKLKDNQAATRIQARWRMSQCKAIFQNYKHAAKIIQKAARSERNRSNFKYSMAIIAQQARMDQRLTKLRSNLSNFDSTGMNDSQMEVIGESQELLTYLKFEIYKLRGQVSDLRADLIQEKNTSQNFKSRLDNSSAALASNSLKIAYMRTNNDVLDKKANKLKKENAVLKKEAKESHHRQTVEAQKHIEECKAMQSSHERDTVKLKKELERKDKLHSAEVSKMKQSMVSMQNSHEKEISSLRQSLTISENAHTQDLFKMFDALDTTRQSQDDDNVMNDLLMDSAQEAKILELKKEIEDMKKSHAAEVLELKSQISSK